MIKTPVRGMRDIMPKNLRLREYLLGIIEQTAKNAGMTAIGVAWGFRGRQELVSSGADYIADDPFSLEEYLLKG